MSLGVQYVARAIAHVATKHGLVANEQASNWARPGVFRGAEALTEARVDVVYQIDRNRFQPLASKANFAEATARF